MALYHIADQIATPYIGGDRAFVNPANASDGDPGTSSTLTFNTGETGAGSIIFVLNQEADYDPNSENPYFTVLNGIEIDFATNCFNTRTLIISVATTGEILDTITTNVSRSVRRYKLTKYPNIANLTNAVEVRYTQTDPPIQASVVTIYDMKFLLAQRGDGTVISG